MSKKKVLVLAANCFSGQDLVDLLLEDADKEVIGVGRSSERPVSFASYQQNQNIANFQYHQLDVNKDMPAICDLIDRERPAWVVNFAAQGEVSTSWQRPGDWFQTNAVAVANLAKHLSDCDFLEKYLHISTPEVYGSCVGDVVEDAPLNPSTPYAASKAAGDMAVQLYCEHYNLPAVIARATNVYGARQQLYRIFPRSVIYPKLGRKIQLQGGGRAVKSYIHIRDVSQGELAMLEKGRVGETYHLSPDQGISIREVVEAVCDQTGLAFDQVTEEDADRVGQDAAYVISSAKVRNELGWKPRIEFSDGISEVVAWVDEYWAELKEMSFEYEHKT